METLAVSLPPAFRHHQNLPGISYVPRLPPPAASANFNQNQEIVALVQWSRPRHGWYKLNFDGSVHHDGSGRASIGGIIRDCYGRSMVALAETTPHAGVGEVEARALISGLHFALQRGCSRLVVEGDDLTLVRLLHGESPHTRIPWEMYNEIIDLLCRFEDVEVQHVYREGNQVADALCHQAYHCPNIWTFPLVPLSILAKIEDDCAGVVHPRFRRRT
jgi:ribonuclease HI